MKRILVDVDCVIADLMPAWLSLYNRDYEDHLTVEDITQWGMESLVKPECGKEIYNYLWMASLYDDVEPIDGAISSIRWLRIHNYDVRFVTSGVHAGKVGWLGRYGFLLGDGDLRYSPSLVIAHDKSLIKGDIMIDDNLKNLNGFSGTGIIFGQPWNDNHSTGFFRADGGWPDVIQYLARGLDR
jgi:5'(3')-deoxyribonucleotidase